MITWKCHICGRIRPDNCISVYKRDVGYQYNLPPDTIHEHIRYCNDNEECIKRSKNFTFLRKIDVDRKES